MPPGVLLLFPFLVQSYFSLLILNVQVDSFEINDWLNFYKLQIFYLTMVKIELVAGYYK